jgi:hypothetical protein
LEVCVVVFVTHVVPFFDKSHFLITVAGSPPPTAVGSSASDHIEFFREGELH